MFAAAVPGLAPLVHEELAAVAGVTVNGRGHDGRSDLIFFQVSRAGRGAVTDQRLIEDVFVEVGRAADTDGTRAASIARQVWRPDAVQRALSVWAEQVRLLSRSMTFRVVARVLQERSFRRTELRHQLIEAIRRDRPRCRVADPAQVAG